jgi:hypothetical protein
MNINEAGREGKPIARYAFERISISEVADQGNFFIDDRDVSNVRRVTKSVENARTLVYGM